MLQINHLTLTHRRDLRTLLRDFSLVLNPGDKAALIGEEGDGKSTLLRWIADPALVRDAFDAEGERDTGGARLGYLPQELPASARSQSVCAFFSGVDAFQAASPRERNRLAASLGFPPELYYEQRPMGSLSGGEKVKLQLAAVLLSEPDILLLDEPSNDIDIETLERFEALIRDGGQAVLYVSHDETLLERTANRVILLEQLRRKSVCRHTVANMPFRDFMDARAAGFEKQARLAGSERREEKKAMEKFRRIRERVEHEQNTISRADPAGGRLLKKKMASVKAMERRYEREHEEMTSRPESEDAILVRFHGQCAVPPAKTVLALRLPELRRGDRVLARDLTLTVRGPEKIGITGRNGAGKTTLLHEIRNRLLARADLRVFYMPQDYDELLAPDETPVSFLAPSGRKEEVSLARTYLGSMRYTAEEMTRPVRALSGGQKAKLLLLKLSMTEADVLLLDEPTRNFSPLSAPEVRAALRGFPGALISVSHDRKYLAEVCGRVLTLSETGLA